MYTGNGNLIPIAFRIEYESIFNKEIRENKGEMKRVNVREMQIYQYISYFLSCVTVFAYVCVCLVSKVCSNVCVANENKCASFSIKYEVNL